MMAPIADRAAEAVDTIPPPVSCPDELMAEGVRKVLRAQFEIMLANEEGSRLGDDIEHVHDMRVAVRRMRAAFRLFGGYFQPDAIKQHKKDLRQTGRMLGRVRDLDVFNREAMRYLRRQPKRRRHDLDPLLLSWRAQRERVRLELIEYLDGDRYQRFVQEFGAFVRTAGAGVEPVPDDVAVRCRVRDVLTSTIWQLYERARAYDRVLEGAPVKTLHALRIDCKYLRYTLEFFTDVLGPDTPWLIRQVIALQNHLGDIQDAEVAKGILTTFMAQGDSDQAGQSEADSKHIAAYLNYRMEEQRSLVETLPVEWARIDGARFRSRLSRAAGFVNTDCRTPPANSRADTSPAEAAPKEDSVMIFTRL